MKEIDFFKYEGTGNDFIVIDEIDAPLGITPDIVRELCDRHYGIGADGVILARQSSDADFKMVFFNSDGSSAEMCGNGIRCYASYLFLHKRTEKTEIRLETDSGLKIVTLVVKQGIVEEATVDMGKPNFITKMIPVDSAGDNFIDKRLEISGIDLNGTSLSMGNPHVVIFVDDLESVPISDYGEKIEQSSIFPNGVNVEFARIDSSEEIEIIVWERGVGITLSCGTGACAATVAAVKNGLTNRRVRVKVPGGDLKVYWSESDCVFLSGPAKEVYSGRITIKRR